MISENKSPTHKKFKPKEAQTKEVFADPTFDSTFKMLLGQESHKHILMSIINSLLNFTDDDAIISVQVKDPTLHKGTIYTSTAIVDVLCETKNNKEIAVEMQRYNKGYFLPRTQSYMSSIIANQVSKGKSNEYDKILKDTYVLTIGRENIFTGKYKLTTGKDLIFEKTVRPFVEEYQKPVPGNKMHWKFYELPRFSKAIKANDIDKNSPLKYQWLNFLVKCAINKDIPGNITNIIKEAYEIMRTANWDIQARKLYAMEQQCEALDIAFQNQQRAEDKAAGEATGIEKGIKKTARSMLLEGDSSERVARITKLPVEQVEKIKISLKDSEN